MKAFILFVLFIFTSNTFSQNVPHLFELKGLEDSLGNTHLFYRFGGTNTICWNKNIYHFDLINNIDTLFIPDFGYIVEPGGWCQGNYIFDYEFFENDPARYIYGGYNQSIDPVPILIRYDGEIEILAVGGITEIEISAQNDSLVYAALGGRLYKSTDGGYDFVFLDSMTFIYNSMISLSINNDSQIYGIDQNKLVRSEDEGYSYIIVDDDSHWSWNYENELYYDADGQHIYGIATSSNESALLVSDGNGDPFTWNLKLTTPGKIWFTLDEQYQGKIYYSYNKSIYKSTDFGNSFFLYKELEQKVTGLYKKSNTDILYASTMFRIYEITPDSMYVIKSLPIPEEIFSYYPLQIGNTWVYDYIHFTSPVTSYSDIFTRTIVDKIVKENGNTYYEIEEKYIYLGGYNTVYERIDSVTAKIYRFDEFCTDLEQIIDDLLAEVGDLLYSTRFGHCIAQQPTNFLSEQSFNQWGITSIKKEFVNNGLFTAGYFLAGKVGLLSINYSDDNGNKFYNLNGAIINGVVYGDTTVVSVDDDIPNLPTEYSLSQNYPNPFNPATKIRFTIPTSHLNPSPYQGEGKRERLITLKVYDVLGNEVATLVNEEKPAGEYEVEFNPASGIRNLVSGIYFYQLRAEDPSSSSGQGFVQTKKMILLK
ncbi:MAG: hypothetical protein IIA49_10970 [Bacteroidetes bacterium]|nr:hypothetical protein [Bacteroidota bacterium]